MTPQMKQILAMRNATMAKHTAEVAAYNAPEAVAARKAQWAACRAEQAELRRFYETELAMGTPKLEAIRRTLNHELGL